MIGKIEFGPAFANNITAVPSSKLKEMQEEITRLHAELLTRNGELEVMSGELEACRKDAERLDFIDRTTRQFVMNVGSVWYSKKTLTAPMRRHKSVRNAIDSAIAAMAQEVDDDPDR